MSGQKKKQQPFWLGGAAASMAATCTHPLDQTKYRMQVMHQPPNILRTLVSFASRDGIPSLWTGLTGSWLRQCSYSTARFGLYNYFAKEVKQRTGTTKLTAGWEVVCSGVAGGAAGLIGNPTEVVLVRMCADGAKTAAERYNYGNSIRALYRIAKEEGMSTFSRGLTPNIVRSVIMNISQIATYSTAKDWLLSNPSLGLKDGIFLHFLASLLAGTVATTACAPADVLKSRVQSAPTVNGVKPSLSKIFAESYQKEGISFLMRGWSPAWLRLAPNTVLMFVFMEQLQRLVGVSSGQPKPVQEKKASEAMKA
ncbi:mitochondrial dicarboxylate transporter [Aureobasidium namibiae CBS 147.97]|uniref:Mitochondrial dicarboxylate transporter n=1 Tax=Aureobasidium namibiae CBS 147.97 TaxID=1043004 RepID=A0A074WH22_9PEZI